MKAEEKSITLRREVYDALLHTLGREHPGTIKAKYALAREILDQSEDTGEAMLLLAELTDEIVKNDVLLDRDFDGLAYCFAAALFDNCDDDETVKSMLEPLVDDVSWSDVVSSPNDQVLQYCDMCDMLCRIHWQQGDLDSAFSVIQKCLETLCGAFPFHYACVEDTVETMGEIYTAKGSAKDIRDHGQLIDFIVARNDERIAALSHLLETEAGTDGQDMSSIADTYRNLYDTLESSVRYLLCAMDTQSALATDERRHEVLSKLDMMQKVVESTIEIEHGLGDEKIDDERFFEIFESTLDGQADDDGDGLEELLEDLKRLRSTVARPDGDMGEAYEAFLAMSGGFTA